MNTSQINPVVFLDGTPDEGDKVHYKRAYAIYLNVTHKTPEEDANKPINLSALLPIL